MLESPVLSFHFPPADPLSTLQGQATAASAEQNSQLLMAFVLLS